MAQDMTSSMDLADRMREHNWSDAEKFIGWELVKSNERYSNLPCIKDGECTSRPKVSKRAVAAQGSLAGAMFIVGDFLIRVVFGA